MVEMMVENDGDDGGEGWRRWWPKTSLKIALEPFK